MKKFTIFILTVILFGISCENPFNPTDDTTKVTLNLNFPNNYVDKAELAKPQEIIEVAVTITADDMDEIVEHFEVRSNRVEMNLELSQGNDRNILVEGLDRTGLVQFRGDKTVDLTQDQQTVEINNLLLIAPSPVNSVVENITRTSFELHWTKSNAPDFGFYRVLLSTNPVLYPNDDQIGNDMDNINRQQMEIINLNPGTVYYVAVIVCDTECYFSGNLEFGAQGSIVRRVETPEGSMAPDPVEVGAGNITSSSFDIFWSKSNADDFDFYRILFSQSPTLDPVDDQIGNDFYDINRNHFSVFDLAENSVYYIAVLTVNENMEFAGSLTYGDGGSIVHKVNTASILELGYIDETFENSIYLSAAGTRLVNKFSPPSEDTFIREVWMYLKDGSGEADNYRLVIADHNRNDIFYSSPLPTKAGEQWVGWTVTWDNLPDGFVDSDFYVGIEYTKDIGWPEVAFDESTDHEAGYFMDNNSIYYPLGNYEFYGNLAILVVVDAAGSFDESMPGESRRVVLGAIQGNDQIVSSSHSPKPIPEQDSYQRRYGPKGKIKSRR